MVWLFIPHIGLRNVRGESNFLMFSDIAKVVLDRGDFIYFVVPSFTTDEELEGLKHERLCIIRLDTTRNYYLDMLLLGESIVRRFNRKQGTGFVDVVLTSKQFIVPYLSSGLSAHMKTVPVIFFEVGARSKFETLGKARGINDAALYLLLGAYITGNTVFITEAERQDASEFMLKFIQPAVVEKILRQRSKILHIAINKELLEKYRSQRKDDTFTIFYGARVNVIQKRTDEVVKLYNYFYSSGRKVKIVICTPTDEGMAKEYIEQQLKDNSAIELYSGLSRDEYLEKASKAHVFLTHSSYEGFPVGFWEQMYIGLIGVFVKKRWSLGQIPRDYPFQYDTPEEAYTMLSWIYDNYEQSKDFLKLMQPIFDDLDKETVYGQLRDWGVELKAKDGTNLTGGVVDLIQENMPVLGDSFTMKELLERLKETGRAFPTSNQKRGMSHKYPSDYDIHRYLESIGFNSILDMENDEMRYER